MQVEGQQTASVVLATGKRVRNTYATYLYLGDTPGKLGLISYNINELHGLLIKAFADRDGRASD